MPGARRRDHGEAAHGATAFGDDILSVINHLCH
jgi:hypothetical protein